MERPFLKHAELNLCQKMVKSGYAKLAEIQSRMEKSPSCQSRIKWNFPYCHLNFSFIQRKKDSLEWNGLSPIAT